MTLFELLETQIWPMERIIIFLEISLIEINTETLLSNLNR